MQRQKRGLKSSREPKPSTSFSRRKRGRASFDDEDEPNDSDDDIEDYFKSSRRSIHPRKDTAKASGRINEVRTSTRSVRKVSYAESEESEEHDEDFKKKTHKVCVITHTHIHTHMFRTNNM